MLALQFDYLAKVNKLTADDNRKEAAEREAERRQEREKEAMTKEIMSGLSVYNDGSDLGKFLSKLEGCMVECEVSEEKWVSKLYPKLTETLCSRVSDLKEKRAKYQEVKVA